MKLTRIDLINFGFNNWNGFYFSLFAVETEMFEGDFLGLHIATDVIVIYIFFIGFEIKLKPKSK